MSPPRQTIYIHTTWKVTGRVPDSGLRLWAVALGCDSCVLDLLRDNLLLYAAPLSRTLGRDIELCYSDTSTRAVFIAPGCLLSGRSAAWLARLVRDQEAGGSNPLAPTILFKHIPRTPTKSALLPYNRNLWRLQVL